MFAPDEYLEMVIMYGECNRNANEATRQYAIRFPQRNHPSSNAFLRLIARAGTTGSLMPQKNGLVGVPRTARTPEVEEMALDAFLQEPTTSIRTISRLYGVSKSLVQRVLKENHQHPYHYTQVQHLQPQDYPARVEFCQWLLRQHADNPNFLDRVIFTDESCFTRNGVFNSRNYHVWAGENPNATRPRAFQHRFSINLWAGILGDRIVRINCKNVIYVW
jgi:hypothetical protein